MVILVFLGMEMLIDFHIVDAKAYIAGLQAW